jgi:hypothetical protein
MMRQAGRQAGAALAVLLALALALPTEAGAVCPGNYGTEVAGSRSTEYGGHGTYERVAISAAHSRTSRVVGPLSRTYVCPVTAPPWVDYWIVLYPPTPGGAPTCEGAPLPPIAGGGWILPDGGEVLLCVRRPDLWPALAPAVVLVEVEVSMDAGGAATRIGVEVRR